jgi:hypothetical protein
MRPLLSAQVLCCAGCAQSSLKIDPLAPSTSHGNGRGCHFSATPLGYPDRHSLIKKRRWILARELRHQIIEFASHIWIQHFFNRT